MNKINFLLSVSALLSNSVMAQEAAFLQEKQPAPFTGILITTDAAQKLKNAAVERDGLIEEKASYERSIELYKKADELQLKKIDILLVQNDKLALRLGESQSMNTWEKLGWLSLGIIATGIAGYSVGKIKTGN
tara:strand:- start:257 stop:655 length:399 start_codon:yes stop_codon:yes gene_type:complete